MAGNLAATLYLVLVVLAVVAARPLPERDVTWRPVVALWSVVAVPSLLEFRLPQVYDVLHRDSDLIRHGHQWWRPFTSFVVQDGGAVGTASNLTLLAVVLAVSVRVWGTLATVGIAVTSIMTLAVPVLLVATPPGGGNSGVTFALAASLAGLALVTAPGVRPTVVTLLVVMDGVLMLVLGDRHGIPVLVGLAIGLVAATRRRGRSRPLGPGPDPGRRGPPPPGGRELPPRPVQGAVSDQPAQVDPGDSGGGGSCAARWASTSSMCSSAHALRPRITPYSERPRSVSS